MESTLLLREKEFVVRTAPRIVVALLIYATLNSVRMRYEH
jgi:hypothetical protein